MPDRHTLPGSARTLLPESRPAGPVDRSEVITLTIRVRSRGDVADLARRAEAEAAKPVAERTYLTRQELADGYGAEPGDLDKVEAVARRHDLVVVHRSAAERTVVLRGRMADMLAAFPANVALYHHAGGLYRGRQGEIGLPTSLEGVVTGIFGFDTRPKLRRSAAAPARAKGRAADDNRGVAATEYAQRYRFPTDHNGVTLDGTGQTIAILELGGGFRSGDLEAYFHEIGVNLPTVTAVSVDHARNHPTTPDSDDGEVMLDIEVAGAVVPAAKLVVYFGPNHGQGFLHVLNAAVHDNERAPSVISISWGGPEDPVEQQAIDAFHDVFTAAAALGITVCVASGDHGTADLDADHWDGKIHVDHPACDPLVLGCGGTQITGGKDVVWNDKTPFNTATPGGGGWASGGGISQVFPVPDYQQKADLPVSLVTGKAGRGVPDIAMSATGYFTRVDGHVGPSGGTSAVAPLMAALVARLSQACGKNVGFLNPVLYSAADAIDDVTSGTNAITGTLPGYDAGPGWDACTGMGTPDGTALLAALQAN